MKSTTRWAMGLAVILAVFIAAAFGLGAIKNQIRGRKERH